MSFGRVHGELIECQFYKGVASSTWISNVVLEFPARTTPGRAVGAGLPLRPGTMSHQHTVPPGAAAAMKLQPKEAIAHAKPLKSVGHMSDPRPRSLCGERTWSQD